MQENKSLTLHIPFDKRVCDHLDLREWQERMGFTYEEAAEQLGVNRSTYAAYLTGRSRNKGVSTPLPRMVSLAAMAIELGLHKVLPEPVPRSKKISVARSPVSRMAMAA